MAVVVAAALVLAIGLAAAGAFAGCDQPVKKIGRPSAAVASSAHGAVAYITAKTLAKSVHPRVADTWGDIRAREFITGAFQQYGYFSLTQEFISGSGAARLHSANIIAVKEGESARRLIVGAHYDSAPKSEGDAELQVTSRFGGPAWLRDDALAVAQDLGVPLGTSAAIDGQPAGVSLAPSDDLPFALTDVATAAFSSADREPSGGAGDGGLWDTRVDTVAHIEKTYPGRVARQLADLSRLLETLLTSKLEKRP